MLFDCVIGRGWNVIIFLYLCAVLKDSFGSKKVDFYVVILVLF